MPDWRRVLLEIASDVENHFDGLRNRLERRLRHEKVLILPYLGHGTSQQLYLNGRVLEDRGITEAEDNDSWWENLANTYRRFDTREIAGARLRATFEGQMVETRSNEEGMFEVFIEPRKQLSSEKIIYEVELELLDYPGESHPPETRLNAPVLVPPHTAQFAVISDIDDTVLQTNVLNLLQMARNTFLQNARTRLPFEGVAAFYRALQSGISGYNPIFYVSSGPWNLYDLLIDFFEVRGIPLGPLFLQDLGLDRETFIRKGHEAHKLKLVQQLMELHRNMGFILIGDSGEHDPDVYLRAVKENTPGRVLAVYIRNVNPERAEHVQRMAEEAAKYGTDWLLVKDTVAAAEHAASRGWILPTALDEIRADRAEDRQAPTPVEALLKETNPDAEG